MSRMNWESWNLDLFTWGWIIWIVYFAVLETVGIAMNKQHSLTDHLQPLFAMDPITWFIGMGIWLWLGYHFLLQFGHPFQ